MSVAMSIAQRCSGCDANVSVGASPPLRQTYSVTSAACVIN